MKKNYFVALLALFVNLATAQQILIEPTAYRGAFAPAPTAQWTDQWTQFDPVNATYPTTLPVVLVSGNITANTTWTAGNVYELTTTVFVKNNATLTIEPGTFIRSKTIAASLIITRGSKLNAIGTAAAPIVFTSKGAPGQRNRGDWGGIVLLGKGAYNVNGGVNFIEGISQSSDTQFGGGASPINNDDSGTLKYVRIEFAGFAFSPNNELNGLTMGAVGSGTDIDYVQVSYSNDDAFEWFGGSVDCKHLVAFATLDDDFDTDNGYNGKVQFGLSIKDPQAADASTSECFESDNNSSGSAVAPFTSAIFSNFTCIGPVARAALSSPALSINSFHDTGARIRRASQIKVFNSLFLDFKRGLRLEDLSGGYFTAGSLKWKNNIISVLNTTELISGNAATTALVSTSGTGATTNAAIATAYTDPANANTTTTTATSAILVTPYPAGGTAGQQPYTGLDYRPGSGSIAETGASFTDATFTGILASTGPLPSVISPITYCKGAVVSPLTAVAAPGGTLNWYTVATGGTPSATPPVVSNSTTKTYYVSQTILGVESGRAEILVTILPAPTTVLGAITSNGTTSAITDITSLVGTTTTTTYQIPAVTLPEGESLQWTVPGGTTIVSGQGTNILTVRFNFVNAGGGAYGSISVKVVNAAGCSGTAKSVALKSALPKAVAFKMYNDPEVLNSTTGLPIARTSFAEYMGTTTPLKLVATPTTTASSYVWELPTGVNPHNLGTVSGTPTTLYYVTYPFVTTVSLPTANVAASANRTFYGVTKTLYTSGVTVENAFKREYTVGTLSFVDTPVTSVITIGTENLSLNPAFPIISTTLPEIKINFTALTPANTFAYLTTATVPVATNALRLGVKARNGVGVSFKDNSALLNPDGVTTTPSAALLSGSTSTLLTLKSTAPKAPSLKLTNNAVPSTVEIPSPAVTDISKFVGTTATFTLTASEVANASSYTWILPAGVNVVSGNVLNDRVLQVNFAGVNAASYAGGALVSGTGTLYFQCKGVNGLGSSISSNSTAPAPFNTSTYKLLKVTAKLASGVSSTGGTIAGLVCGTSYNYSLTPSSLANSYVITAPTGSIVTSANFPANTSNVLATTEVAFTVQYPAVFVITTATLPADKTLTIASVNGVGSTLKTFNLTTQVLAAVGVNTNDYVSPTTGLGSLTLFGKCGVQTISVPAVVGATSYIWTLQNGATGTSTTNSIDVDFSTVTPLVPGVKNIVKVKATNGCVFSAEKSITLTWDGFTGTCPVVAKMAPSAIPSNTLTVSIYPNPASNNLNVEVTTSEVSEMEMTIVSINGAVVSSKNLQLTEGNNVINENISSLSSGIYFVRFYNSTSNETIVKKLVKN